MGNACSEVAKEAGDIVILDNFLNYQTGDLIRTILIYNSICKFIVFQLTDQLLQP